MTIEAALKANYRSLDTIKWIVIHHSATEYGNVDVFRKYHVERRGFEDVGYHYVICNGNGGPDGAVQTGRPLTKAGAHAYGANRVSVGICLVGDFTKTRPTKKQWDSLIDLCRVLMERFNIPISNVIGHKEVSEIFSTAHRTRCPGDNLPPGRVRAELSRKAPDYKGHWAEDAIRKALEAGIMHGYPDGTFRPEQPATRAELAAVLVNIYERLRGEGA